MPCVFSDICGKGGVNIGFLQKLSCQNRDSKVEKRPTPGGGLSWPLDSALGAESGPRVGRLLCLRRFVLCSCSCIPFVATLAKFKPRSVPRQRSLGWTADSNGYGSSQLQGSSPLLRSQTLVLDGFCVFGAFVLCSCSCVPFVALVSSSSQMFQLPRPARVSLDSKKRDHNGGGGFMFKWCH